MAETNQKMSDLAWRRGQPRGIKGMRKINYPASPFHGDATPKLITGQFYGYLKVLGDAIHY
jgi:hypothetical protein